MRSCLPILRRTRIKLQIQNYCTLVSSMNARENEKKKKKSTIAEINYINIDAKRQDGIAQRLTLPHFFSEHCLRDSICPMSGVPLSSSSTWKEKSPNRLLRVRRTFVSRSFEQIWLPSSFHANVCIRCPRENRNLICIQRRGASVRL